jgi:hypothetical protein
VFVDSLCSQQNRNRRFALALLYVNLPYFYTVVHLNIHTIYVSRRSRVRTGNSNSGGSEDGHVTM